MPGTDYNSGLPVRTEADGVDERVHVKIVDGTSPAVNQMAVDSDKNAHVENHGNDPAGVDRVMRTSELGSVSIDGVYDVTNNTDPSQMGLVSMLRNDTPTDSHQVQRVTGAVNGAGTIRTVDVSLLDENGEPYTPDNPIPVSFEENEGDEICDYQDTDTVAVSGTATHDYTVSASKVFVGSELWASASGKMKAQFQVETGAATDVFNTKFVGFNSTANPNIRIPLAKIVKQVNAGARLRLILTNRDNAAQCVYSTLLGVER